MRLRVITAGLFSLLTLCGNCTAQIDVEDWIEQDAPDSPDEEPASLEYLQWLQDHPIDINSATVELLCRIPGMERLDAQKIITFRMDNGPYRSTDDLSLVPDLSSGVVRRMEGFIVVSSHSPAKQSRLHADLRVRTVQDLQLRDGYRTGAYRGSADKSYARLTGSMEETMEAGILVEKDAGETPSAGFLSGYVSASNLSVIDRLIAGDFRLEVGEGLVFWQGGGFGGNLVEGGSRNPRGLVPHRSTDEFHFLRGIGASAAFSLKGIPFRLTGFISERQLPGTTDEFGLVTGLQEDGVVPH